MVTPTLTLSAPAALEVLAAAPPEEVGVETDPDPAEPPAEDAEVARVEEPEDPLDAPADDETLSPVAVRVFAVADPSVAVTLDTLATEAVEAAAVGMEVI